MNAQKRHSIFSILREANPAPVTELEYSNPFQLLIAVLLSAQATDVSVNKATRRFFSTVHSPEQLLAIGLDQFTELIKSIGLYRTKAKNALLTCQQLIDLHGSQVPQNREALEALPGVGRKTANVVLNTAFGWPTIAVDTHIFRVSNRTGIAPGKTVEQVEQRLLKFVPQEFKLNCHHWLILHGRYVCKAQNPQCGQCRLFDLCEYKPRIKIAQISNTS